jgi:membrane protein YdbS with pleckstrin-like domain
MSTVLFQPDIKFRHKLFLTTGVSGVIALLGSIAVGILIGATLETRDGVAGAGAVGFIVAVLINLAWLMPVLLIIPPYFRSLHYEIHDDEVIVRAGVITKTVKHVPFRTVTNLEVKQGPFDRFFGIGTLNIQTAGMGGTSAAEESLGGLRNFEEVYDQVATELRRYRAALAPTQA